MYLNILRLPGLDPKAATSTGAPAETGAASSDKQRGICLTNTNHGSVLMLWQICQC